MQKLPTALYSAAQVRVLDSMAINKFGVPGFELMSRAGQSVFQIIQKHWPTIQTLAVFCGAGNNGGDGYIVARLALQHGLQVRVYSVLNPEQLKGDAYQAYKHYVESGGKVTFFQDNLVIQPDLIIDALLGTGLDRVVSGLYADAVNFINTCQVPVVAVDIPSGLHADTGNVMDCAVRADKTITFIGLKQGLFTGQAADYCGDIIYESLNVPEQVFAEVKAGRSLVIAKPLPRRSKNSHKGCFGHVLVVGGDVGYSGAARLAGEAALRVGAGLVSIATRHEHAGVLNLNRPELMCHGVGGVEQLRPLLKKADVIVIGPGLGQSQWAQSLFNEVVLTDKPKIMDADALNLLAEKPLNKSDWILTPHPGEAARLLACTNNDIQSDRFKAVTDLQTHYGGIAVLKGQGTLISDNAGIKVNTTGNPGMASGGMGDVLAGVIAGLAAQIPNLSQATEQAVYIHGLAADKAAEQGERGLLASDLMSFLRQLVN